MNTVNQESKSGAIKTLAIIGFIVAVVAGLWITVQVVRFIPTAFSSLASIADSLYGEGSTLSFTTEKDVVNSGESLRLIFVPVRTDGSYVFSYRCVDGITAETRNSEGEIVRFDCDEEIEVASGKLSRGEQTIEVNFISEKGRFSDVPFTFAFYKADAEDPSYEQNGVVTIVNASIPQTGIVVRKPDESKPTPKPIVTTPVASKPAGTAPVLYKKVAVSSTGFPVSNPNGFTDLEIIFLGVGEYKNGKFESEASLEADNASALQFAVKNIGTKTSSDWSVDAKFPGDDEDSFSSKMQSSLLPGERAIMTIRFTTEDNTGTEKVSAKVTSKNDSKSSNNSFSQSVKVTN